MPAFLALRSYVEEAVLKHVRISISRSGFSETTAATHHCANMCTSEHIMNETLSIRIDPDTKKRLDALSKRSKCSKSFLAAEAIAAYVDSEEWQVGEVQAGIAELDREQEVSQEKVAKWLKSWGKASETKAPR